MMNKSTLNGKNNQGRSVLPILCCRTGAIVTPRSVRQAHECILRLKRICRSPCSVIPRFFSRFSDLICPGTACTSFFYFHSYQVSPSSKILFTIPQCSGESEGLRLLLRERAAGFRRKSANAIIFLIFLWYLVNNYS